jgi:CRISP-associated protein Cas1
MQRVLRVHPEKIDTIVLENSINRLTASLRRLQDDLTLDEVRRVEGDAVHVYFGAFDHLIIRGKEHFFLRQRNRKPPLDRINCLLSFLYQTS